MFEVNCDNGCGKTNRVNSYYKKIYKHHFCSRKCYNEYKKSHPQEFNGRHVHKGIQDYVEMKRQQFEMDMEKMSL